MSHSAAPRWALLLVLCGAIFLEGIDIGMLNVAHPPIRAELGLTTGELQWVMSAYVLGYGGFMLLGGRAADLFGRRRMFLVPLAVFVVFSALGYALFLPVGADWTYPAMLPSMLLVGVAFALVYGPLTIVATDGIAPAEQGLAGGLLYTSFQFGAAFGLAAVTAVSTAAAGAGRAPGAPLEAYRAGLVVPTAAVVLALLIGVWGLRGRRPGHGAVAGRCVTGATEASRNRSVEVEVRAAAEHGVRHVVGDDRRPAISCRFGKRSGITDEGAARCAE
ncbi:MFS transporter [Streptomyces lydicus]|uniref:MFS transporter n=1 Tax=Streptomyces lydicus TaxID=47763 RepID=UPI0010127955|nr:MFS transporter [Streptomyces lydicus]MCZ1006630.1 MFS transporter [Streptomyces lydicus]